MYFFWKKVVLFGFFKTFGIKLGNHYATLEKRGGFMNNGKREGQGLLSKDGKRCFCCKDSSLY